MKHTSRLWKSACSLVQPVHHKVKIDKRMLSPRFPELKYEKNDIRSPRFKPVTTHQDALHSHYLNTLKSDLLLINFEHNAQSVKGSKFTPWDGSSPYHINRPPKRPAFTGSSREVPDLHPIDWSNIPELESVVLNCYVNKGQENINYPTVAYLQLQQITSQKPSYIYSKKDMPAFSVRRGKKMGAKIILKGKPMYQFLTTLNNFVLPRIREFKGISKSNGNGFGSISIGLKPSHIKFFPEINYNEEFWPTTFGMHININTTSQTDTRAKNLLSALEIPIQT
ncbi:hypothetical protein TBLA_0H00450 [Henningerozyma blattae CBS 6284]|uniref:Ribosomal protein L5 C-terminal domain-containing protein n=1 Tax=Henningerozyma blattae (strain ATCC 34711 / CBS 6284 / DSM 70876 / NBRC 10599 / NRRL Y-10934 / UCD 77-7) TaxID=1071380 RepID=I2H7I6_HENB6|nr:hypothetical protein TBLA_0H00450 [Tetrapisispora blattae CBS 6284]CCH62338.1 hypothetical protein TBLA_0H00450 [Tetrapisispora blattae CBS 6284]